MSRRHLIGATCLATSFLAIASVTLSASAAAQESADEVSTDEIIVTANKREQAADDVGMSISVLGAAELQQKGIRSVEDIAASVPGLTFAHTQFDEPVYTLRGVGYVESSLAASPAVSVYVDEVPLPYPSMTRGALLDVERVEVLKGPQGTLFGQNSTGGAINYIAAKPTDEFEGGVDLTYGRFNAIEAHAFASGPLVADKLKARIAVGTSQGGAWQKSQTRPSDELGDKDELIGRLLLDFTPTESFRLILNINGWRDKSDTPAAQHKGVFPAVPGAPVDPLLLAQPIVGKSARLADWNDGTAFGRDTKFYQTALRAEADLSDAITLTSLTAYQRLDRDELIDADATPGESLHLATGGHVKSFVQEARLSGKSDHLNWLLGVNYQKDNVFDLQTVFIDTGTSSSIDLGPLGFFHFPNFDNITSNNLRTWAVFGSGELKLTDNLALEVGARYTSSRNRFEGCTADPGTGELANLFATLQFVGVLTAGANPTTAAAPGECITLLDADFNVGATKAVLDEDNLSWRVNLNWSATDNVLLYANASRGYKAGNFPNLSASTAAQFVPVTQEKLMAYEVGAKITIPEQRMQINGAAFYYDYTNKQLRGRVQDPLFGQLEALVNIPDSHVWGLEGQWLWRPAPGLNTSVNASYIETEIDGSFVNFTQFGDTQDFAGNEFPYSPNFQASADIDYEHATPWDGIDWFVGVSGAYSSATKGGLSNRPELAIDNYFLLDVRAGLQSDDDRWRLTFWGKNVTNEYYIVNVLKAQDNVIAYAGRPATFGATLAFRF